MFEHIPAGEVVDFSSDVFPAILEQGGKLHGEVLDGYWEDVGTLEAYRAAHEDILDGRVQIELPGFQLRERVWLGENSDVATDVVVEGPVLIGDNCRIESGAVLRPYTVLGDDVVVKAEASVERSVVHDHVYIGQLTRVRGAVLGRASDIRDSVRIEEGVVVGDESFIGAGAIINPSIKIYPFKSVDPGAVVTSSIVWESRGARARCSAGAVCAGSPTSTSRPRSRCGSRWRTAPRSRRARSSAPVVTPVARPVRSSARSSRA